MPALPNVPQVLKAVLSFVDGDAVMENILHWAYAGAQGGNSDLNTLAADIYDAWATNLLIGQSEQVTFTGVELTDLTSDTAPRGEHLGSTTGGLSTAQLPAAAAIVVSHKIERRYRGGHPRTYIGGLTVTELANAQQLPTARVLFWNGEWVDFRTAVAGLSISTFTPLSFVSVSYRSGGVQRVTPVVDTVVDSQIQDRICTQRRRNGPLLTE